jgi:1,2-diacylglycerol 3-alpha-glucosyltransferase
MAKAKIHAWEKLLIKRLPSIPLPNSPTGQSRIVFPVGASIPFLLKFKPDIIHTQSPYGTGLEAVLASKVLRVPLVGTNHTPIEEFVHYAPGGRYYEGLARKYDAWYYNRCTFVTAPYQGLIDNMRTQGFKRAGRGQPNPVPFTASTKTDEQRQWCKVRHDVKGKLVLVSGRLAPEKQVDVVLRAFKLVLTSVPDATLVITGRGSNEQLLKELAKTLEIEKHVRFAGFVQPEHLDDLYCTADIYVVMSTAETQSLSLMQAFASGVPAVAAKARGLIDYCAPGAGFLVEPGDEEMLSYRIIELLTDEALRQKMGSVGVEFVKKFTTEKIAEDWEKIYQDALQ